MKKVFSHESLVTVNHLRNLLQAEGIEAVVRNDGLLGVLGEVPFIECWPQLWVLDERKLQRAESLIRASLAEPVEEEQLPWTCPNCRESIDGHFAACWNCGTELPGSDHSNSLF